LGVFKKKSMESGELVDECFYQSGELSLIGNNRSTESEEPLSEDVNLCTEGISFEVYSV
jgi:hypothetical protein